MAFQLGINLLLDIIMLIAALIVALIIGFFIIVFTANFLGITFDQLFSILWVLGAILFVFIAGSFFAGLMGIKLIDFE